MTNETTIFVAKKIVTMNPSNPEGTHVAVREGKILGVGTLEELECWGDYRLDDTFKDKVLTPGFVEAHAHAQEGSTWGNPYIGYFDRTDPKGKIWPGCKSLDAVIARIKEISDTIADPSEMLIVWGFEPIYFAEGRMTVNDLDKASATRPIYILHSSGHKANVNSAALRLAGITRDTQVEGVLKFDNGEPNGELLEFAAMFLVEPAKNRLLADLGSEQGIRNYGMIATNTGHTTVTELGSAPLFDPNTAAMWQKVVNDPTFQPRVALYYGGSFGGPQDPESVVNLFNQLKADDTEKLRMCGIKMWLDGSLQGLTSCIAWPGYIGQHEGIWNTVPEQVAVHVAAYHKAGINVHIHCNGDLAIQAFIEAVEDALRQCAWLDHRHTVQHCPLLTPAQYRKMAKLGMSANLFVNHVWYWGDQHYEITLGPERAKKVGSCGTAKRENVQFSFHSDANITPLGHLHTMWCAVNRVTPKGRVLGEHEKISAYDALHAATLGAAYQLHMDHEIGSLECGKFADFAVLEESPLDVDPMKIKDIKVWGTVVGGVKYKAV